MVQIDRDYELLEREIEVHHVGNRTRSTALLAWFLETVWRLEPGEVSESICDGGGDKGIDALHVDDDAKEITVLQSRHRSAAHLAQGDNDLKQLVGSAVYFSGPDGIDALMASGPNAELRKLVDRLDLRARLADREHTVSLIFVTNALLGRSASDYLEARSGHSPTLDVWGRNRLAKIAARTEMLRVGEAQVTLAAAAPPLVVDIGEGVRMLIGLVEAPNLVRLPGIDDLSIFELNVRLGLGRTRINNELAATVREPMEHKFFSTYHNGMTLLTREFEVDGTEILLRGVSVVNGCQSLLALYYNRTSLTPSLQILVRIVELGEQGDLVDRITYRTNNQNPVNIRDQRSKDKAQRDLQAQLRELYGQELALSIRNGERLDADATIDNTFLAQMVMATYLEEPWNAVRKLKLLDQEYHRVFNRHLDAHKILFIHLLNEALVGQRSALVGELNAAFSSIRFTLAHLVFRLIALTPEGKLFLADPSDVLAGDRSELIRELSSLASEAVESANYFLEAKEREAVESSATFDPKVIFKSRSGVASLERDAVSHAQRMARRDEHFGFRLAGR